MVGSVKQISREIAQMQQERQKVETADAHCHLDLISNPTVLINAINFGVHTIITDGINVATSKRALEISEGRYIFPAIGIDPETAVALNGKALDNEISQLVELARQNRGKIIAIGEIGLDYMKAKTDTEKARQKKVFERMLDLAKELDVPVSVHSRESMDAVLEILEKKKMEKVQLHFFEGNVEQAKEAEKRGYMISIPPTESSKRKQVIKDVSIDRLMAESDCPVVGKTPIDVEFSIHMIADIKGIPFMKAAETLTNNTKRFFGIETAKLGHIRG
ncbi:MAG: TatD family hydrolase [Candidatus Micrarchaeales archaeon]|nr:TatD family hydrolase [Candidatus Micrarchaeales archaeon]